MPPTVPATVLGLLFDASGSFDQFAITAKRALHGAWNASKHDDIAIGTVKGRPHLLSGEYLLKEPGVLTERGLAEVVDGIVCDGRTALWETAAVFGQVLRKVAYEQSKRVALFIVTDGMDNDSADPFNGTEVRGGPYCCLGPTIPTDHVCAG